MLAAKKIRMSAIPMALALSICGALNLGLVSPSDLPEGDTKRYLSEAIALPEINGRHMARGEPIEIERFTQAILHYASQPDADDEWLDHLVANLFNNMRQAKVTPEKELE